MRLFKRLFRPGKLVIVDDASPNVLSGFRIAEYNDYLTKFPGSQIYSAAVDFDSLYEDYVREYPQFRHRLARYSPEKEHGADLYYTLFLNNAFNFLPHFTRTQTPFVFTLYPGGGLWLDQADSDAKLAEVLASPLCKKVIVTQRLTRDYLLKRNFGRPEQVEFIYGGVPPASCFEAGKTPKARYPHDKPTFDICFVAFKYMAQGLDKGYDTFVAVAHELAGLSPAIRFHVVGNFDAQDCDIGRIADRITFYGPRTGRFFPAFYAGMDLVLSPNVPFRLYPGGFDGFPTGCCIEAGLSGVAVFCTDPLGLNVAFHDGRDFRLMEGNARQMAVVIAEYFSRPEELYRLALAGQQSFRQVFHYERQLAARRTLLEKCL